MTTEKKYTPHIHAEVIKAWADGKPIEWRARGSLQWRGIECPRFFKEHEYRVKPKEVVDYTIVLPTGTVGATYAPETRTLLENGWYPTFRDTHQGFCKRTTIDGKVVALEFIPR